MVVAGGTAGRRRALPNARILIHQLHGGAQGQSVDIEIQAKEMDTDRDDILSAEDAVTYGLIDQVIKTSARLTAVSAATP